MITKLKFEDLKGTTLKKILGVKNAIRRYHNKHVDNSGNFGFTIISLNDIWFTLDGNYDKDHNLKGLDLETFGSWTAEKDPTYQILLNKLNEFNNKIIKERSEGNTYMETLKDGMEVTRIKRDVDKETSFKEFQKAVNEHKVVCLSDLMINSGF